NEGIEPGRVRVIRNGIDADAHHPAHDQEALHLRYSLPPDKAIVGMVANFSPVKDHALFLKMAALLARERDGVHFLLAGSGPTRAAAERLARELGIADRLTRVASVSPVQDLLAVMDVSVLTSRMEGFPNVVIESMAAGVPVVAAAVGGIPELIGENERGV